MGTPLDAKADLHRYLRTAREAILWKLDGLSEYDIRRPLTPTGTNLLGLVKHLAAVEYGWFCQTFGREADPIPFDESDPDADMRAEPHETTAEILDYYERARRAADRAIGDLDLGQLGRSWSGQTVSMRWVLINMIEETARHAGHMDIVRELIDGATGDHPDN